MFLCLIYVERWLDVLWCFLFALPREQRRKVEELVGDMGPLYTFHVFGLITVMPMNNVIKNLHKWVLPIFAEY